MASSTSFQASFSQSSEDWWTIWKRSSSWCARSSGPFWSASSRPYSGSARSRSPHPPAGSARRSPRPRGSPRGGAYFAHVGSLCRRGPGAGCRLRPARPARPAADARRVRGPAARARARLRAPPLDRGRPGALADPLRPARGRQDDARPHRGRDDRSGLRGALRGLGPRRTTSGVVLQAARDRLGGNGQRTILFLDEIHRFNKAQQDALLPSVEDGLLITLIGATTENPYFEVNSALLSRCQVYELEALDEDELLEVVRRGAEAIGAEVPDDARRDDRAPRRRRRPHARSASSSSPGRRPMPRECRSTERHVDDAARKRPLLLRQGRRPALRLHLGLHQVDARLRSRRGRLLPRGDARGRRGSALHRPADDRSSPPRTSATPIRARSRSPSQRRTRSSTSASRRRSSTSPRRRSTSRVRRSRRRARRDLKRATADVQEGGNLRPPAIAARRAATAARRSSATARATSTRIRPARLRARLPPRGAARAAVLSPERRGRGSPARRRRRGGRR